MAIEIPDRLYDYVLYYECGQNEKSNPSLWTKVGSIQPGGLIKGVNWSSGGNDVGDGAGITKCGVVLKYSIKQGYRIDSANSWIGYLKKFFWDASCANQCATVATALQVFQGKWAGWTNSAMSSIIKTLKSKADKPTSGIGDSGYSNIAKLTHCFSNPMDAFVIIRAARIAYLRSCGNAKKFANGWMRREFFAFQTDGLYVETGRGTSKYGFTPIPDMEKVAAQLKQDPKSGYVKLMSWDGSPSSSLSLEGISDGADFSGGLDGSGGGGGYTPVTWEPPKDGGTKEMGLNKNNSTKGMVVGLHINQK